MFGWFRRRREQQILKKSPVTTSQWQSVLKRLPLLTGLSESDRQELIDLATIFMHDKVFEGAQNFVVTLEMKMLIAIQACLPVLKLGLDGYDGWYSVIVYPAGFAPERVFMDEYGVEHHVQSNLSGESWHKGPVILAWDDTEHAGIIDGQNLIIHEFAHKLDIQNGSENGYPPLHKDMSHESWVRIMTTGFQHLQTLCEHGKHIGIDCYAATSPAEYFAVMSEVFFERPRIIQQHYPDVYEQLKKYYRQDPIQRLH